MVRYICFGVIQAWVIGNARLIAGVLNKQPVDLAYKMFMLGSWSAQNKCDPLGTLGRVPLVSNSQNIEGIQ